MMNKQSLEQMWDHLRGVQGISMRLIETLPEDKIHTHPIAKMRTPAELIAHIYAMIGGVARGTVTGTIVDYDQDGLNLKTKAELIAFAKERWNSASKDVAAITDQQLMATVQTPWNMTMPGFVCFGVIHDEFLHHRGQLYTYLRALGQDVPMMWDFEHNAAEYRPRQAASA